MQVGINFDLTPAQQIRRDISLRLRARRLVQGLSQVHLAQRIGISVVTLQRLENQGESSFENFVLIAIGLGMHDEFERLFLPMSTPSLGRTT